MINVVETTLFGVTFDKVEIRYKSDGDKFDAIIDCLTMDENGYYQSSLQLLTQDLNSEDDSLVLKKHGIYTPEMQEIE